MNPVNAVRAPVVAADSVADGADGLMDAIVLDHIESDQKWKPNLNLLVQEKDLQTVVKLAHLRACCASGSELATAVGEKLNEFKAADAGYAAARMLRSPTAGNLWDVFRQWERPGGDKTLRALWESTMNELANAEDGASAVAVFKELLEKQDKGLLHSTATDCLKNMLARHLTLEKEIRTLLQDDGPLRMDAKPTLGDGNCLFHAVGGKVDTSMYFCTHEDAAMRAALVEELETHDIDKLSATPSVFSAVSNFYLELMECSHLKSDLSYSPSIKFLANRLRPHIGSNESFDGLPQDDKKQVYEAFKEHCATRNESIPVMLVPVLARALKKPISLYQAGENWRHFDGQGNTRSEHVPDAVAIRFDARQQHFERVEPPQEKKHTAEVPDSTEHRLRVTGNNKAVAHRKPVENKSLVALNECAVLQAAHAVPQQAESSSLGSALKGALPPREKKRFQKDAVTLTQSRPQISVSEKVSIEPKFMHGDALNAEVRPTDHAAGQATGTAAGQRRPPAAPASLVERVTTTLGGWLSSVGRWIASWFS